MMLPETDRLAAAEYALGLLDGRGAAKAERRLREDRAFADEVWFWEEELSAALDAAPQVTPPRDISGDIARSLFGVTDAGPSRSAGNFPWKKFVLGVVAFKAALLSAFLYSRSLAIESHTLRTPAGEAVLHWNARSGALRLSGAGASDLHLWARTGNRLTYLGPGGGELAVGGLAAGTIFVSSDGPGTPSPQILADVPLSRR